MTPRRRVDALVLVLAVLGARRALALPKLERVLDKPCRALALDQEPYVAALGDDAVTVLDKRGTHEEKLPDGLRGPNISVGVFFGRDYRVRLAGTAHTPTGDEVRYYRSLPGGLRPAPDELGPLGKPGAPGLVALLGTADPEIVCRAGISCLIKRISGWAKASAPVGLEHVGLSWGSGWAIAGTTFYRLEKDWVAASAVGPWRHADDAFVRDQHACVVEHDGSRLHHFDGAAWHSSAAPVTGPRSVWGGKASLWIAGDGGAAVLVDDAFQSLPDISRVAQVLGRSDDDVWLCTNDGVFRARGATSAP
jgi:hypothetical protein